MMKKLMEGIFFTILLVSSFINTADAKDSLKPFNSNKEYSINEFSAEINDDEIWITGTNDPNLHIVIDKYGNFSCPAVSATGYVAYKNYDDLYLCKIDSKNNNKSLIVDKDVSSYAWQNNGDLIYSKYSGGLYIRNGKDSNTKVINIGNEFYTNIIPISNTLVIGEKNGVKNINGFDYSYEMGVVGINLGNKGERLIVSSIHLGGDGDGITLTPKIMGTSRDGTKVFIEMDKVPLRDSYREGRMIIVYNVETEQFDDSYDWKINTV